MKLSSKPTPKPKRGPPVWVKRNPYPQPIERSSQERLQRVRQSLAELEDYPEQMTTIQTRIQTITDRIDAASYDEWHPKMVEARDVVDELTETWNGLRRDVTNLAAVVDTDGRYLPDADLQRVARNKSIEWPGFTAIEMTWPELFAWGPWNVLRAAAVPF